MPKVNGVNFGDADTGVIFQFPTGNDISSMTIPVNTQTLIKDSGDLSGSFSLFFDEFRTAIFRFEDVRVSIPIIVQSGSLTPQLTMQFFLDLRNDIPDLVSQFAVPVVYLGMGNYVTYLVVKFNFIIINHGISDALVRFYTVGSRIRGHNDQSFFPYPDDLVFYRRYKTAAIPFTFEGGFPKIPRVRLYYKCIGQNVTSGTYSDITAGRVIIIRYRSLMLDDYVLLS